MIRDSVTRLAALAFILVAGPALAAAPTGDPRDLVAANYAAVQTIAMEAPDQATLTRNMTGAMDVLIDYDAFSQRTLKGTWDTLDEAQRARFKDLFKRLIIKTYAKRFKPQTTFTTSFRGDTTWEANRAGARVASTVTSERVSVDVTYIFKVSDTPAGPAWRAYDLEVDEVSMALNWRQQFRRVIKRDGFDALLERIRKKVEEG